LSNFNIPLLLSRPELFDRRTAPERTRRIYDLLAAVYPVSAFFFHSKAHKRALEMAGIRDGMRVLEVATGSGEMFRRLVRANTNGATIGLDLSPRMASRTQRRAQREFPGASAMCQAVDARWMPFRDGSFDAVVCCYLLELLSGDDIQVVLGEFHRVLKPRGSFTLVTIGENAEMFNRAYRVCGRLAPAFWGRQVERRAPELIEAAGLRIASDRKIRQGFYPSRILTAQK
jgi:ubiquinone/menaquinone biosynthesis C-methylase UbiE